MDQQGQKKLVCKRKPDNLKQLLSLFAQCAHVAIIKCIVQKVRFSKVQSHYGLYWSNEDDKICGFRYFV